MIEGINHITLAVADIEVSFNFYAAVLGFTPVVQWTGGAYFTVGSMWLALNVDPSVVQSRRPDYSHLAFSCTAEAFPSLKQRLVDFGCAEWSRNRSEGASFYFLDPDGHKLELHVGDLSSRVREMQSVGWADFRFYETPHKPTESV